MLFCVILKLSEDELKKLIKEQWLSLVLLTTFPHVSLSTIWMLAHRSFTCLSLHGSGRQTFNKEDHARPWHSQEYHTYIYPMYIFLEKYVISQTVALTFVNSSDICQSAYLQVITQHKKQHSFIMVYCVQWMMENV